MREAMGQELRGLCDFFFPPACLLCGVTISEPNTRDFCPLCRAGFLPLPAAHCPRCALPFATIDGSPHHCGECLRNPPAFDWTIAAGLYEDGIRHAVHRFKFDGALSLDRPLAALLVTQWQQAAPPWEPNLLVPTPLHPSRLRLRTFNQSLLLARELGRLRGLPVAGRLLTRVRATRPQPGLTAAERLANLSGAFAVDRPLAGEKVLLVDDVMTSGATARSCALALRQGGAACVAVAILGRARRNPPPYQLSSDDDT